MNNLRAFSILIKMACSAILLQPFMANGQNQGGRDTANPEQRLTFGGFVRADAAFDTRMNAESREGFFVFYPLPPSPDINGDDIHARAGFNQWAMTTRLWIKADGPEIGNAKTAAVAEGDFTGPSNIENNALRLRHAYFTFTWANRRLLIGQYWTPLDLPEALPRPLALNTGAPFHSFARSPQIRLEQIAGKWKIVGVALSQRDYQSPGPDGYSAIYSRRAIVPNLHLQLHYTNRHLFTGAGLDYKRLSPRLTTTTGLSAHESLNSFSLMAFLKFEGEKFAIKTQSILGQNLTDHLMAGGYAVEQINAADSSHSYINLNHLFIWADLAFHKNSTTFGVFAGYFRNLGTARPATPVFYGRGHDIGHCLRISPRIEWKIRHIGLAVETEYTWAGYGQPDERYHPQNISGVHNLRLQAAVIYHL